MVEWEGHEGIAMTRATQPSRSSCSTMSSLGAGSFVRLLQSRHLWDGLEERGPYGKGPERRVSAKPATQTWLTRTHLDFHFHRLACLDVPTEPGLSAELTRSANGCEMFVISDAHKRNRRRGILALRCSHALSSTSVLFTTSRTHTVQSCGMGCRPIFAKTTSSWV